VSEAKALHHHTRFIGFLMLQDIAYTIQ
jgi:hypothetical protein